MKTEYLEITAAAGGRKPSVKGVAYSGGKMRLFGWSRPVVVDMAGMSVPETVPLLANHENHTLGRVGVVSAKVEDGHLEISGEIVGEGDLADAIVGQGKAGADWQLSIGAEVEAAELVQEGKRTINGVEHEAPFYHVTKSTLREVSVVAVGADKATHMKVTASLQLKGNSIMEPEKKVEAAQPAATPAPAAPAEAPKNVEAAEPLKPEAPQPAQTPAVDVEAIAQAAVKAERDRVGMIKAVCNGEFPEIEAKAISEGWNKEQVNEAVLAAFRAKQPTADVNITIKKENSMTAKRLEAALSLRAGIDGDTLAKAMGEETVEAAQKDADMPLAGILAECMRLEGMEPPRTFDNAAIKAAFSTVSLPGILSNVANKKLMQAYEAQPIIATKLCTTGDLTDFKENQRFRLTDIGDLKPVGADGEIKDGALSEESAKNQLETYAKKFCLTRKMIINDDLGAFLKVPTAMGNRAARDVRGRQAALRARSQESPLRRELGALRRLAQEGDPDFHRPGGLRRPAHQRRAEHPARSDLAQVPRAGADAGHDPHHERWPRQRRPPRDQRPRRREPPHRLQPVPLELEVRRIVGGVLVPLRQAGRRGHLRDRLPQGQAHTHGGARRPGLQRPRHLVPGVLRHRDQGAGSQGHGQGDRLGGVI